MKAITLTDKQRIRILGMCIKLFPELGSIQFGVKERHGWSHNYLVFGIDLSDEDTHIIHWFEFMMTELAERIFNPKPDHPNRGLQDKMKQFFWQVNIYWWDTKNGRASIYNHPIDDLYTEFKKLKGSI